MGPGPFPHRHGLGLVMLRSRTGLALKAIRDNDLAAESIGVNLWREGVHLRHRRRGLRNGRRHRGHPPLRVQPASAFAVNWSGYLIFITVIGGIGTLEGPIIGTLIYFVLRETTSKYGEWYFIVLGLVAVAVPMWSLGGHLRVHRERTRFSFPGPTKGRLADAWRRPAGQRAWFGLRRRGRSELASYREAAAGDLLARPRERACAPQKGAQLPREPAGRDGAGPKLWACEQGPPGTLPAEQQTLLAAWANHCEGEVHDVVVEWRP